MAVMTTPAPTADVRELAYRRAVFLDKDGTLVVDVPHNGDPDLVRLAPRAGEGLRALAAAGFALIVVTNQPGIAQGRFGERRLRAVRDRIDLLLTAEGVTLEGFYYCPHDPDGTVERYSETCDCRKPLPGLVLAAGREHRIDMSRSWLVGDILDDIEAGQRAGCRTVLIDNGNETEWMPGPYRVPHLEAGDMGQAARAILAYDERLLVSRAANAE